MNLADIQAARRASDKARAALAASLAHREELLTARAAFVAHRAAGTRREAKGRFSVALRTVERRIREARAIIAQHAPALAALDRAAGVNR